MNLGVLVCSDQREVKGARQMKQEKVKKINPPSQGSTNCLESDIWLMKSLICRVSNSIRAKTSKRSGC